jgi:aryl-alcohol dehydrogenase
VPGKTVRGVVEGDSVPKVFLPVLMELWEQGRFPVDLMMSFYDFDGIDEAAHDAEERGPVKAVLRMS